MLIRLATVLAIIATFPVWAIGAVLHLLWDEAGGVFEEGLDNVWIYGMQGFFAPILFVVVVPFYLLFLLGRWIVTGSTGI